MANSFVVNENSAPKVKSVWGVPSQQEHNFPSLHDVMSEQLADHLNAKEEETELRRVVSEIEKEEAAEVEVPSEEHFSVDAPDCSDDLLIAQMLQMEFDKEYDQALEKEVNHVNGSSKVKICYSKYKRVSHPLWDDPSDDDEEDFHDDLKRDVDSYETADKEVGAIPRCGYKKIGGTYVTKHDRDITERANGRRIMEFPPGIETGDGAALNAPQIQVSNAVYNSIRNFSIKEGKRKNRVHDKIEKSTSDQAVDPQTRLLLFKMINNGYLESIHGIISTGKEAVIIYAEGGPGPDHAEVPLNIPKECAIKIFKTTLNEFKNRDKYIRDDYRFRDRFSKQNPRKVIHMWAEKEMHNLMKMSKFGITVPEVVLLRKHVLVMSFVGSDGVPAPKLKDAKLTVDELDSAYEQTVTTLHRLYNEAHLVHADLSEFNILWHDSQCWFIDVSQAVEPNHPSGLEFLYRDCKNVSEFFSSRGVQNCLKPVSLFASITGLHLEEFDNHAEILAQVHRYQKNEEIFNGLKGSEEDKSDAFDYCWEQSKSAKTPSRPIPGHPRPKPSSGGKSPRSPKSTSSFIVARSPKTPPFSRTPPASAPNLVGLTDEDLKKLKEDCLQQKSENDLQNSLHLSRKTSQVKFLLDDEDSEDES